MNSLALKLAKLFVGSPKLLATILPVMIGFAYATGEALVDATLEGTWRLVSVGNRAVGQASADAVPFFTITGTTVRGFDGCNEFFGRIDVPGEISATRRGCPEGTTLLPIDLGDMLRHLQSGTIVKNSLAVPARGTYPPSVFNRDD